MFQKKTSRRTRRSHDRMLELRVSSPRILMFEWLRFGGKVLKVGFLMLIVGAAAFMLKSAWNKLFLNNLEEFGLAKITLTTFDGAAPKFLYERRVAEVTGLIVNGGQTIFQFDTDEVQSQLLALPEISKVDVTRRLPDCFEIKIKERVPIAWIVCPALGLQEKSPEKGLLIDRDGIPFRCASYSIFEFAKELPAIYSNQLPEESVRPGTMITHEGLNEARKLIIGMTEVLDDFEKPESVIIEDEITLKVHTRSRTVATFSFFDQKRQIENFKKLTHHAREKGEQLASVNLIPYRLVPVKYR